MATRDALGRPLSNLRLSVTDRCNLRCAYCMPEESYRWLPRDALLSFEELSTLVDAFVALGVRRVRLTGGEPLLREGLPALVQALARKPLEDLSLTTNGVLLPALAGELKQAGLQRLTVSLDTLRAERFERLTRRKQLGAVLEGLHAARRVGFTELKLDTVVMRGVNDDELDELLRFARELGAELRFIEYMDVGGATRWSPAQVVPVRELLERLGPARPLPGRGSAPAQRYARDDGQIFGIIGATTQPFCAACDRARVTADGTFFSCLYATHGVDLRPTLRAGGDVTAQLDETWRSRRARGAEERLALRDARGPLANAQQLRDAPHLEMHTRGG